MIILLEGGCIDDDDYALDNDDDVWHADDDDKERERERHLPSNGESLL